MTVRQRLLSEWQWKIALLAAATVLLLGPYMLLQRFRLFESRTLELTAVDTWAEFSSAWVWVYVLQYIQVPIPPLLTMSRAMMKRYLIGFAIVCMTAFVVFIVFPVEGPRPAADACATANWLYRWLIAIDEPGNALPSLHVALATYSMCFAHRLRFDSASHLKRKVWLAVGWVSVALITWSTMATKQHYFIDGATGFALAVVAHQLVWRTRLFGAMKNPAKGGA